MSIEKSVIDEVSEAEENNTTHVKVGNRWGGAGGGASNNASIEESYGANSTPAAGRKEERKSEEMTRDRNRDSMFGTMLINVPMSKEHEARINQMQYPHLVMQQ